VEGPADGEGGDDGEDAAEEPGAELVEVLGGAP